MTVTYKRKVFPMTWKREHILIVHKDTQGPCPNGFHIGTQSEWLSLKTALTILWVWNKTDFMNYLKVPSAYYLNRTNGSKNTSYWPVRFWTSTMTARTAAYCMYVNEKDALAVATDKPANAFPIRPFRDEPVVPDLNDWWVQTFDWSSVASWAWIYRNSTLGLISMSKDWTTWITVSDKNLWATNVWDNWLYYQFWNNYWFTENPSSIYTSTQDATGYWPGNYYNNEHFVKVSTTSWMTSDNNNIWWWVTNGTWTDPV